MLKDYLIDHIHWPDLNELVNRLRLLLASQTAGSTSNNNEIISVGQYNEKY